MKDSWFVVADAECPGVELSTYEEAAEEVRSLQKRGNKDARIINPAWERDSSRSHDSGWSK